MDPITLTTVFWFFVKVALMMGMGYLGGKYLGPSVDEDAKPAGLDPQSTGWNPFTTQQEGIPEPRAYGRNLHHGNILGKWTEAAGNRETMFVILEHTSGPTKGIIADELYINDQPIGRLNHPSKGPVVVQERFGTMDQTVMTGFEKQKFEYAKNIHLLEDEYHTFITPNTFNDDIEFTFWFPNGLMYIHSDGGNDYGLAHLKIYGREYDVGAGWEEIVNEQLVGASFNPRYFPFTASVEGFTMEEGKQYEFKAARTDTPALSTNGPNDMYLKSIRTVRSTAFTRPGKALVGIKAIATSKLSGKLDIKSVREDRIINTYNGEAWTLQYSNNRAWVVWDILTQPVIDGNGAGTPYSIYRYEGIDPSYLDLEFFYAWSLFCEEEIADGDGGVEPRCVCNIILDTFDNVWDVVYSIAAAGRAHLYWRGDKLSGWVDDVVLTPVDLVTMDSMMAKTWQNSWTADKELAKVVEVLFKDSKQGYEKTPVEAGRLDVTGYQNTIGVEGTGLTTRGAAAHLAYYMVERNRLIRNINNFRVHKDGFRYKLGDVIRLQSRPANWGHAFRVVSSAAINSIDVDRDASGEISGGDILHIRSYDPVTEQVVTDTYEVDAVAGTRIYIDDWPWDVTPAKGNLVAVGPAGAIKLRRIIKIESSIVNYFNVTVETYDAELFDADDIDPDNPTVNYLWPGPANLVNSEVTRQELDDIVSQSIRPSPNIDVPWPGNLTWTGDSVDTVKWEATDTDFDITFRYAGTTHVITADSTTLKYIYWNPNSPTVFLKTNVLATAMGAGHWMMCINEDGDVSTPNPQRIMHGGLIQAGTITAGYGQIGVAAIGTLEIIDHAVIDGADDYNSGDVTVSGGADELASVVYETTGAKVFIQFSCAIKATGGSGTFTFRIYRDSTVLYTVSSIGCFEGYYIPISFAISNTPSVASYTWKVTADASDTRTGVAKCRSLHVHEFKK